jgi:nitrate reductase gamma subunit
MYHFITGPLLWFSFVFFITGCFVRIFLYFRGLDWRLDRVTYTKNVSYGVRGAARSLFSWLVPYGTRSWRNNPVYTAVFFLFHFGILVVPLFISAHTVILSERWGVRFYSLPGSFADAVTVLVIFLFAVFVLRRIALPHVRILTGPRDILALIITAMPFITGFFAYHQVRDPEFWTIAHILSGEIMLIAVPITRLSHAVLFFCTRIQLGMDFGIKRGGMKAGGMNW